MLFKFKVENYNLWKFPFLTIRCFLEASSRVFAFVTATTLLYRNVSSFSRELARMICFYCFSPKSVRVISFSRRRHVTCTRGCSYSEGTRDKMCVESHRGFVLFYLNKIQQSGLSERNVLKIETERRTKKCERTGGRMDRPGKCLLK